MFAEIDIDGNGFIDAEELETGDSIPLGPVLYINPTFILSQTSCLTLS